MAANYWESTQRQHWLYTKDQLASMRQKLDDDNADWVRSYPLPEQRHLSIFFNQRALYLHCADFGHALPFAFRLTKLT